MTNKQKIDHPNNKMIATGNNIRAAVFGINDGLISNASLIMGMAGANVNNNILILAGIAGLLAGAFSMGAGEFISVRSQREMFEYQIELEKKSLELSPKKEAADLAKIYHERGVDLQDAKDIAQTMLQNPESAIETLAREELGLNPDDLVSPYGAAISSFLSFIVGAAIPLIPYFFSNFKHTILISIGFTSICLFLVGSILSSYTGRNPVWSGLRMLLIGVFAGGITYLTGHLLGVQAL